MKNKPNRLECPKEALSQSLGKNHITVRVDPSGADTGQRRPLCGCCGHMPPMPTWIDTPISRIDFLPSDLVYRAEEKHSRSPDDTLYTPNDDALTHTH